MNIIVGNSNFHITDFILILANDMIHIGECDP